VNTRHFDDTASNAAPKPIAAKPTSIQSVEWAPVRGNARPAPPACSAATARCAELGAALVGEVAPVTGAALDAVVVGALVVGALVVGAVVVGAVVVGAVVVGAVVVGTVVVTHCAHECSSGHVVAAVT
jgi:hypothetical protein